MIQVTKKKKETTPSLLKRFSKKIKQSSNLPRFKNAQYKKRAKSSLKKKKEALSRIKHRAEREKLYKLGKLE